MPRVWFDRLTKRDARALARWWNSQPYNGHGQRFVIRRDPNNSRLWALYDTAEVA